MRILYLSPIGELGGAERVLLSVLKGVRRSAPEHELHLLCLSPGPMAQRAAELGVHVDVLPLPAAFESLGDSQAGGAANMLSLLGRACASGGAGWGFVRRLQERMRRVRADLIHSNGIKTHALTWLAAPPRTPIVWHVHDFFGTRALARHVLRLASRRLSEAVAVSSAVADDLKALSIPGRIGVIANGTDLTEFAPGPGDVRRLDSLARLPPTSVNGLRVGLVATYARWKGHGVFLEAAARVRHAAPDMRFYIIGGPIYRTRGSQVDIEELRGLVHKLGVADRVGFIGFQREIAPLYRALDVVVHASTAPEPFGLTIVEAMACGRAVVASYAGGVTDIIQPDHDALGVPPGDRQALADALLKLHTAPALRQSLGAAAAVSARRFDEGHMGPRMLEVYRRCVPRSSSFVREKARILFKSREYKQLSH